MPVSNGDIKNLSTYIFKKYYDLLDWLEKKEGLTTKQMVRARNLLKGIHVTKDLEENVIFYIDWDAGRMNTSQPHIINVFTKEVNKYSHKFGITIADTKERYTKNQVTNDNIIKYKYINNPNMKNIVRENIESSNEISKIVESLKGFNIGDDVTIIRGKHKKNSGTIIDLKPIFVVKLDSGKKVEVEFGEFYLN